MIPQFDYRAIIQLKTPSQTDLPTDFLRQQHHKKNFTQRFSLAFLRARRSSIKDVLVRATVQQCPETYALIYVCCQSSYFQYSYTWSETYSFNILTDDRPFRGDYKHNLFFKFTAEIKRQYENVLKILHKPFP